jgi:hypothetical protein
MAGHPLSIYKQHVAQTLILNLDSRPSLLTDHDPDPLHPAGQYLEKGTNMKII